ncbi:uncharacterized protein AMSG_03525 [Thecamonas trahens ATCC 50062]|uniref:PH domain-containing protein n=1 Tax=Thecamonas trahens ATCC 50062 TaxID=461836 RepID=A0A0L0D466_THETB|nr:hypothetical protein AMSG_03525 [Thecamonas trahens ATCC 50062]KNC47099.1 hypothetical protein AMSG_03525 [Thecamonas trahens ATCC 50062]|eukprot:XP_013759877.1 hypothetical protein AMSG_03525 [Thecamonas trahens ATCC 50062]
MAASSDIEEARAWIARSREVLARHAPQRPLGAAADGPWAGEPNQAQPRYGSQARPGGYGRQVEAEGVSHAPQQHVYLRGEGYNPPGVATRAPPSRTLAATPLAELPGAAHRPTVGSSYLSLARLSSAPSAQRSRYALDPPAGDVWRTPFGEIDVVMSVPRVRDRPSTVASPIMKSLSSRVDAAQATVVASQSVLNRVYAGHAGESQPTPAEVARGDALSGHAFGRPVRSMVSKAIQTEPESKWKTSVATSTDGGAYPPTERVLTRSQATRSVIDKSQSLLSSYSGDVPPSGAVASTTFVASVSPQGPTPASQQTAQSPRPCAATRVPRMSAPTPSKYLLSANDAVDPERTLSPYRGLPDAMRTAAKVLSSSRGGSSSYVQSRFPPPSRVHDLPFPRLALTPLADRPLSPSSLRRSVDASAAIGVNEALDAEAAARRLEFTSSARGAHPVARSLADSVALGSAAKAASSVLSAEASQDAATRARARDIVYQRDVQAARDADDQVLQLERQLEQLQRDKHELHVLNATLQHELLQTST